MQLSAIIGVVMQGLSTWSRELIVWTNLIAMPSIVFGEETRIEGNSNQDAPALGGSPF